MNFELLKLSVKVNFVIFMNLSLLKSRALCTPPFLSNLFQWLVPSLINNHITNQKSFGIFIYFNLHSLSNNDIKNLPQIEAEKYVLSVNFPILGMKSRSIELLRLNFFFSSKTKKKKNLITEAKGIATR